MSLTLTETAGGTLVLQNNNTTSIVVENIAVSLIVSSAPSATLIVNNVQVTKLNDLNDVLVSGTKYINDILKYNGTNFVLAAGSIILGASDPTPPGLRPGTIIYRE